jgi:hypothetical protein
MSHKEWHIDFFFSFVLCLVSQTIQVLMQPFLPHFGKVYFAQAVSHGLEVCVQQ